MVRLREMIPAQRPLPSAIQLRHDRWLEKRQSAAAEIEQLLCFHISGGGTVTEFETLYDLPPGSIDIWVNESPARLDLFTKALACGNERTKEKLISEFQGMAFSNIQDLCDARGRIRPPNEWPEHAARAVEAYEEKENVDGTITRKVKLRDKVKPGHILAKHLGIFQEKVEVSGALSLEAVIAATVDRNRVWPEDNVPLLSEGAGSRSQSESAAGGPTSPNSTSETDPPTSA